MITPSINKEQSGLHNYAGLFALGSTPRSTTPAQTVEKGMLYQNALFNFDSANVRSQGNKVLNDGIKLLRTTYNGNFSEMHSQETAKMASGAPSWIEQVYNLSAEQQRIETNRYSVEMNADNFNNAIEDNKERMSQVYLDDVTRQPIAYNGRYVTVGEYLTNKNRTLGYDANGNAELFTPPHTVDRNAFDTALTAIRAKIGTTTREGIPDGEGGFTASLYDRMMTIPGEDEDVNIIQQLTVLTENNIEQLKLASDNFWNAINEDARDAVREEFYSQKNRGRVLMVGDVEIDNPEEYAALKAASALESQAIFKWQPKVSVAHVSKVQKEEPTKVRSLLAVMSTHAANNGEEIQGRAWDVKTNSQTGEIEPGTPKAMIYKHAPVGTGTQNLLIQNAFNVRNAQSLAEGEVTLRDYRITQLFDEDHGWINVSDGSIKIVGYGSKIMVGPRFKIENGRYVNKVDWNTDGDELDTAHDQLYVQIIIERDGSLSRKLSGLRLDAGGTDYGKYNKSYVKNALGGTRTSVALWIPMTEDMSITSTTTEAVMNNFIAEMEEGIRSRQRSAVQRQKVDQSVTTPQ